MSEKNIKISETVEDDPSKTKRITAYIVLFILFIVIVISINKFGIHFLTFFIFILLLLIPVFVTFEKDIIKFLGYDASQVEKAKKNVKKKYKKAKTHVPEFKSSTKKKMVLFVLTVALITTLLMIIKSKSLKKSDITMLLISNFILINAGALTSYTFI